ncbi:unnamed protein product [Miscanthus lutarioriparius]|uniref:Oligopeptide transporter 7 n=1 Tax=Miscanthus lutarioriparius TaxID=422564 RepID=A0A811SCP9_9POAL|nr:unnamed protein product [Miscanthus lutarioriparius]
MASSPPPPRQEEEQEQGQGREEAHHHGGGGDDDDQITTPLLVEATTSTSRSSPGDEDSSDDLSEGENSPIEEVALTVPVGDDPSTPVLTFRMWVLGTASCALLSFLNQFFWYRKEPLTITAISAQIAVVPLGRLMGAVLPARSVLRGTRWEFSLNPGPFNVKEHVLITIFANSGAGTVYAIHVITAVRVFYGKNITFFVSLLVVLTTQTPGLNIITEYIMGYLYPGRPVANMCFKVYGYISMSQALTFLQDFKLGHYMKIPPRTMFMAQVVGTLIAAFVYLGTAWWLMDTVPNICNTELLPSDSPWTCPGDHVFYDASVIWGLISPRRIFGDLGTYSAVNWFFLGGAIAPFLVWLAHKAFPGQSWILLINMPVLIGATGNMPPATAVNYTTWILVGFLSGYVVYRYRRDWWERHNYLLSGALDAGLAFMAVLIYLCLGLENISLNWWGNDLDGCPLASCPTAKGIVVEGCPVYT